MKKRFFGIFICLFAILLMSHNVFAADVDFNGEPVTHQVTLTDFYSRWNSNTSYTLGRVHTGGFNEITSVEFYPQIAYQLPIGAYYMEINYNLGATNAISNNPLWYGGPTYAMYSSSSAIMPFLSSNEMSSTTSGLTYRTYRSIFKYAGGTLLSNANPIKMASSGGMFASESYRINSVVFWKVNNSGASNQDIINSINNQSQALNDINDGIQDTNDKLDSINDTLEQQQQDEQDALDDATQDAQDGADNSQQQADSATSGLISIIGGFVSAITNTSPSNCNLNGNMGHLNMGLMDLCSLPVPSFVQIIGSIILILVCIPFVIIMFNRFISLFRSFQG